MREAIDRIERNDNIYVEEKVRGYAANMIGDIAVKQFWAKTLYDLVILSHPHQYSYEDMLVGESKLEEFSQSHFLEFVQAFYQHLCGIVTINDSTNILIGNPWVEETVDGETTKYTINIDNIKSSDDLLLDNFQKELKKRILYDTLMSPFRRSLGPGLAIIVWIAIGEFHFEIEVNCRGEVEIIHSTNRNRAIVMGTEIKASTSDISNAKFKLMRRFKIIAKCLEIIYGIKQEECIFEGRFFFRNVLEDFEEEDDHDKDFTSLSFHYHEV